MADVTPLIRVVRVTGGTPTELGKSQGASLLVGWSITDVPGAGTHTYRLEIKDNGAGTNAGLVSGGINGNVVKR